ncbi:MAG: hypothetical protein ACLQF1_07235 [Methyloceanibacter sp.]
MATKKYANGHLPIDDELRDLRLMFAASTAQILEAEGGKGQPVRGREDLYRAHEALAEQIVMAERAYVHEHAKHAEQKYADRRAEWIELVRQRALTIVALRRLNRDIEKLRLDLSSGGQHARMVLADRNFPIRLGGIAGATFVTDGISGALAREYLREAINAGVIKAKEADLDV